MPRRSPVSLPDVAAWDNLGAATWRAARGKHHRPEVRAYLADLDRNLARLRSQILAAELPEGEMTVFEIHDPKRRTIHAPCFAHRVLHHALMHHLAPVIERSLVADTFACIPGRGTLAAVKRAQAHVRRHAWYAKIDVASYFASIDHLRLQVEQVDEVNAYLHEHRGLAIKPSWQVGRSAHGLRLCGVRVLPHALRLSPRRRRRYRHARARWEALYRSGTIDANTLQRGYDSALAITAHTMAVRFRLRELECRPAPDA